jgi:hypothetical protein
VTGIDPLARLLGALAADSYAVLHAGHDLGVLYQRISDHPARSRFDAALADDEIGTLFPAGDAGYVFLSTGEGRSLDRDVLPALIVAGAANRLHALHETFSVDELVQETERFFDQLRHLVRGKEVEFPALSMFCGISIAPEVSVELPWGVLSRPTPWPNRFAEWARFDLMLVTNVPIRIAITEPGEDPQSPSKFAALSTKTDRLLAGREQRTSLSLLLALPGKPGAVRLWRTVLGPFVGQGLSAQGGNPRPLFGTQAHIDTATGAELARWGRLVNERYTSRLDIATDRLISSVTIRHDPGDALVDAVIALEAMFAGTDHGELTFRIAAGLASLLEPTDPEAREQTFKKTREIYEARNKIVHGRAPSMANAGALRDRAFELGRQSLGRLYERHPDLLGDDARARRLILRI